jgi:hypothetical protein
MTQEEEKKLLNKRQQKLVFAQWHYLRSNYQVLSFRNIYRETLSNINAAEFKKRRVGQAGQIRVTTAAERERLSMGFKANTRRKFKKFDGTLVSAL